MKNTFLLSVLICFCISTFAIGQDRQQFQLSTHILDISRGKPASGIVVSLYKYDIDTMDWEFVDKGITQENGRIESFLPTANDNYGAYKLRFEIEPYFEEQGQQTIYPYIEVAFYVTDSGHYHIPITVSANGYSTYRGS